MTLPSKRDSVTGVFDFQFCEIPNSLEILEAVCRCFAKFLFLKISQNSGKYTYAGVFSLQLY